MSEVDFYSRVYMFSKIQLLPTVRYDIKLFIFGYSHIHIYVHKYALSKDNFSFLL
jgi:hypothetical protein